MTKVKSPQRAIIVVKNLALSTISSVSKVGSDMELIALPKQYKTVGKNTPFNTEAEVPIKMSSLSLQVA